MPIAGAVHVSWISGTATPEPVGTSTSLTSVGDDKITELGIAGATIATVETGPAPKEFTAERRNT